MYLVSASTFNLFLLVFEWRHSVRLNKLWYLVGWLTSGRVTVALILYEESFFVIRDREWFSWSKIYLTKACVVCAYFSIKCFLGEWLLTSYLALVTILNGDPRGEFTLLDVKSNCLKRYTEADLKLHTVCAKTPHSCGHIPIYFSGHPSITTTYIRTCHFVLTQNLNIQKRIWIWLPK